MLFTAGISDIRMDKAVMHKYDAGGLKISGKKLLQQNENPDDGTRKQQGQEQGPDHLLFMNSPVSIPSVEIIHFIVQLYL